MLKSVEDDRVQDRPAALGLERLQQLVDLVVEVGGVGQHLDELAEQEGADCGFLVVVLSRIHFGAFSPKSLLRKCNNSESTFHYLIWVF